MEYNIVLAMLQYNSNKQGGDRRLIQNLKEYFNYSIVKFVLYSWEYTLKTALILYLQF